LSKDAAGGVNAYADFGVFPGLQLRRDVGEERRAVDFVLVAGLPEVACELLSRMFVVSCLYSFEAVFVVVDVALLLDHA